MSPAAAMVGSFPGGLVVVVVDRVVVDVEVVVGEVVVVVGVGDVGVVGLLTTAVGLLVMPTMGSFRWRAPAEPK
jgi:hypothetical protein